MLKVASVDLGASSGRVVEGVFDGKRFSFREAYRFPNYPVSLGPGIVWDFPRLFHEVKMGLRKLKLDSSDPIHSMGVDTWGLDFGLVGACGELVSLPNHHRDPRNEDGMRIVDAKLDRKTVYEQTGIQFMPVNTINQLARMKEYQPYIFESSKHLLMIPDLFHFFLTGQSYSEYTITTTSQLIDIRTQRWHHGLITELGVKQNLFTEVVYPGTDLGLLQRSVQQETDMTLTRVVAVATHDTASAVIGTPLVSNDSVFISCGSWSLVGVEIDQPIVNETTRALNLSNEGGAFGTIRLLKNSMGLWILQELKREYELLGQSSDYPLLVQEALAASPFKTFIFPDDPVFLSPNNMVRRIRSWCRSRNLPDPESRAELVRCVLESLAMRYRDIIEELQSVTGRTVNTIHMVGGGSQNDLLCQWTADATGKQVIAGPGEATSFGNIAMQLYAAKEVSGLAQIRELVRGSFNQKVFEPEQNAKWQGKYFEYRSLLS